jgi:hypothetical protein
MRLHKPLKINGMFGLFKKKTEAEQLDAEYKKVLKEAYTLSTTNRKLSDQKTAEAEEILKKIERLRQK